MYVCVNECAYVCMRESVPPSPLRSKRAKDFSTFCTRYQDSSAEASALHTYIQCNQDVHHTYIHYINSTYIHTVRHRLTLSPLSPLFSALLPCFSNISCIFRPSSKSPSKVKAWNIFARFYSHTIHTYRHTYSIYIHTYTLLFQCVLSRSFRLVVNNVAISHRIHTYIYILTHIYIHTYILTHTYMSYLCLRLVALPLVQDISQGFTQTTRQIRHLEK